MTTNVGTLVISPIRPFDSLDTYPAHYSNDALGGLHEVADNTERDSIPDLRRIEGMLCYTTDSQKTYQLVGGTGNANWQEFSGGTSSQNLWETFVADSGSATASSATDTFSFAGTGGITTEITGNILTIGYTGSATDELVKVSIADTNSSYLSSKLTAGSNVTLTVLNTGSDELLEISATSSASPDEKVKISSIDTNSNYLINKITSSGSITRTILNTGSDEILSLDVDVSQITMSHHTLSDLTNYDDHPQYVKLLGRTGGQQVIGGLASGDILKLQANADLGIPTAKILNLGKTILYPDTDKEISLGDTTHNFHHICGYDLKILQGGVSPNVHTTFVGGNQSTNLEYTLPVKSPLSSRCFLNASLPTPQHSHTLGWVDVGTVIPEVLTGTILMYGGATSPAGYLLCDGASYLKTSYVDLYGIIGVSFGEPDLISFNVPNFKIKFPKGYSAGVAGIGDTGGSATHTPAGSNSAPAFTGTQLETHQHAAITAGTPAGTVAAGQSADSFSTQNCNINAPNVPVLKAETATGNITAFFTGTALETHQHAAITAGTPAGSVAAPVFTGTSANTEPEYLVINFIIKY